MMDAFDLDTSLYDVIGVEINSRMNLGINAFEEKSSIVISRLGIIFDENFSSDGFF